MFDGFLLREGVPQDTNEVAELRHCLWPDSTVDEHLRELTLLLAGEAPATLPYAVLVAQEPQGRIVGFVEVGL